MTEVNAKEELTLQLVDMLSENIYDGIKSIFDKTKEEGDTNILKRFQEKLCSVPLWNQNVIDKEYERIISKKNTEHLDKLLDMLFVSHVKVLSVLKINDNNKIDIQVPNSKTFIHKCYIETARAFYKDPYLIDDRPKNYNYSEIQRNIKRSHIVINNCIQRTIRDLIPLKEILEAYSKSLEEPVDIEEIEDEIEEDLNEIQEPEGLEEEPQGLDLEGNEELEELEGNVTEQAFNMKPELNVTNSNEIQETPSIFDIRPTEPQTSFQEPHQGSFQEQPPQGHGSFQEPHHASHQEPHEQQDHVVSTTGDGIKNILIHQSHAQHEQRQEQHAQHASHTPREPHASHQKDDDPFFSDDDE
jgi:hypothetical protein